MLAELRVKEIGIIEEINWRLSRGLNIITGETGAGKSLVIDAVESLLVGKLDEEALRHGASKARIEGVFILPDDESISALRELLSERGIEETEETLVISCELQKPGRSTVRVNGYAVARGLLHQIGHYLVDVHGQSEHLSLRDRKYHLDFIDAYARVTDLRQSFGVKATEFHKVEQELKALTEGEKELARREEFLRFQLDEIGRAKLQEGEEEKLERERSILTSSEQLKALSYEAYQALYGEDASRPTASAADRLNEALNAMKKLIDVDPSLQAQLGFLEETSYRVTEVAHDIRGYHDRLEYDPKRLEEIELRLELIRNLQRKYGQTITEVLDYQRKAEVELEGLSISNERRVELEERRSCLREEMGQMAFELSQARGEAARKLEAEVKQELQDLDMSQIVFEVAISQVKAADGIPFPDGDTYAFTNEGVDIVEFMVSTNPGEPLKPLTRIASTGEISRFMLALKGALSQADHIPVLIFDEVDIGVGGRSGEIIGRKLWALARNRQVICVTHLPQIAAFADAHYRIQKEAAGSRTLSRLQPLEDESQLRELAVMLGGHQYTETSLDNARELRQKASTWKENCLRAT